MTVVDRLVFDTPVIRGSASELGMLPGQERRSDRKVKNMTFTVDASDAQGSVTCILGRVVLFPS